MSRPFVRRAQFWAQKRSCCGGSSQVPWTPAEITTTSWYDASDGDTITSSGGKVSQWDDKSGNDYHVAQGTGALQPTTGTRTINSLNTLDFAASSNALLNTANASSILPTVADTYLFHVCEYDSATEKIVVYGKDGTGIVASSSYDGYGGADLEIQGGTNQGNSVPFAMIDTTSTDKAVGTTSIANSTPVMQMTRIERTATTQKAECWLNGVQDGTNSGSDDTTVCGTFIIGSHGSSSTSLSRRMDGKIGEVIVAHAINTATRQLIEGYLAHKWGLEGDLPGGHPYKSEPPYV